LTQARTSPALLNAARNYATEAKAAPTEVSSILEQKIRGVQEEVGLAETGRVLSVGYIKPDIKTPQANQWQ
jgi:F-type H+-transporting ATPase subunit alpha